MLDHRMAVEAELAGHVQYFRLGMRALERDTPGARLAPCAGDALQLLEKIEMPEGAAELAIGHGLQADLLLLADDAADFLIFDGAKVLRGNLPGLALGPCLLQ